MTVFAQTGLNSFLLSLQTANPSTKKDNVVTIINIFGPNISSSFDTTHAGGHSVKQNWKKIYLKILMRVICIGCTLRSILHEILLMIRTFPRGLENNHACKGISDNFPGVLTYGRKSVDRIGTQSMSWICLWRLIVGDCDYPES